MTLTEAQQEITRLRSLLIDPGSPAWEDARAVLVAELRKAQLHDAAASVAEAGGSYVPSWIALNLIAQARQALQAERDKERDAVVRELKLRAEGFAAEERGKMAAVALDLAADAIRFNHHRTIS